MSRKRFNKFGNYGIEQIKRGERLQVVHSNFDKRTDLLRIARKQLRELENLRDQISWSTNSQFKKLKTAFRQQNGFFSEEQLRWLQRVYDQRFDLVKKSKVEKQRPMTNPFSASTIAKIKAAFGKKT